MLNSAEHEIITAYSTEIPKINGNFRFISQKPVIYTANKCLSVNNCWHFIINEQDNMSRLVRKPAFCICENKDADQLRGNHEADQRLCFRYTDSTISLLPKYKISSLQPSSVAVQPSLCGDLVGNPEDRFSHNEAHIMLSRVDKEKKAYNLWV